MMSRGVLALSAVLALAVAGCDDPAGVQLKTVKGEVTLYDELGQELASAGGVLVGALSMSSGQQYQTTTKASGSFKLRVPDEESVSLQFSREGFGDMFAFDVEVEGEPMQVDLFARSSATPVTVIAEAESCGTVNCLALALAVDDFFGTGTSRRVFRVYLSTDPGMTLTDRYTDYEFTGLLFVPNDQPGLNQVGTGAEFQLDGIHGFLDSFTPGATVYLDIYGATENLEAGYESQDQGLMIFTDLSAGSARTSFVIPW